MMTLQKFEFQSLTVYPEVSKKRRELDVCNVAFCVLVILIHVLAEPVTQYRQDSVLYVLALGPWRLSAFVVQGFLFLAGVKLFVTRKSQSDPFSYSQFYLGRLYRAVPLCRATVYSIPVSARAGTDLSLRMDRRCFDRTACRSFVFCACDLSVLFARTALAAHGISRQCGTVASFLSDSHASL